MAQYSIKGKVVFEKTQQALSEVQVFHHQSQKIQSTDGSGNFEFVNLEKGLHIFSVFASEFSSQTDTIQLSEDMTLLIEMLPLHYDISTIHVTAKREELFAIKRLRDVEGTSIFAGKKSEVVVMDLVRGNLAQNNGRQVYAQVAGLNIYEGNDGGLQLNLGGRGLDPNRTSNFNTRQNGYDISADVLGYPENYYTPPSEAISEVRIIRGASSLQYGTQFGGLIDFKLRKISPFKSYDITTAQTIGSFNSFNSYNAAGFNKNKITINSFYNFKRGDGYRDNSGYNAHTFFLSAGYLINNSTSISAEFSYFNYLAQQAGGLTDQQFLNDPRLSIRERNWFNVDWKLYNISLKHALAEHTNLQVNFFRLDAQRNSVGFRGNPINLNENPIIAIDEKDAEGNYLLPRDLILGRFKNFGAELRSLTNYNLGKKKSVFLIGSKYYNSNNTSIQGPGSIAADANFNLHTEDFPDYANQSNFDLPNLNISVFSENIFYLSNKLSLTPGIRIEYIKTASSGNYNQVVFDNAGNPISNLELSDNRELGRKFALMGIGIGYKKSERLQIVANVSQNYRSVTFSDIRVVNPSFIVDPEIRDEKGFTADMGVRGRLDKFLAYDLSVFSVLYNDRIGIIFNNRAERVRKNIGQALIAGTESLINLNIARWVTPGERNYNVNLFVNSAFTFSRYLSSDQNNVEGNRVEFIPLVNLKSGINVSYASFELAYQYSYLSQQFTDVQNSPLANVGDIRSGLIGPIPSYHISDLTIGIRLRNIKISGGVNNAFDSAYFTRRATGYPGPGIIPSDGRSYFLSVAYGVGR